MPLGYPECDTSRMSLKDFRWQHPKIDFHTLHDLKLPGARCPARSGHGGKNCRQKVSRDYTMDALYFIRGTIRSLTYFLTTNLINAASAKMITAQNDTPMIQ